MFPTKVVYVFLVMTRGYCYVFFFFLFLLPRLLVFIGQRRGICRPLLFFFCLCMNKVLDRVLIKEHNLSKDESMDLSQTKDVTGE